MSVIKFNVIFLLICVICLVEHQVLCRRGGSGGRPRTTPRSSQRTTHHSSQQANNYQPVNTPPPSVPVQHQQNNPPPIGFDNVNRQSSGNQPIGFERPPQANQPPSNIGFSNPSHPPQQVGGYNPQVPQQPQFGGGHNPQAQPPATWGHPNTGYNPSGPQFGAPHAGGGYNPYLSQPGSYYQNYATPGVQPHFYQPPQQSSGIGAGSLLGIAGGFGGGYLLGRLTGGGHDHKEKDKDNKDNNDKNEQQFIVHHYYHNSQEVPKQITVSNDSVATCMQNVTQKLCVPNTFPMCLTNGTIMCVTHTRFTVPCGTNTSSVCIITALPCNSKDKSCNTASNLSTNVVYVPCISNVTVSGQNNTTLGSNELCITAIAEPVKKLESPVPSLVNLMSMIMNFPFQLQGMNFSSTPNVAMITSEIKTEMPPMIVGSS